MSKTYPKREREEREDERAFDQMAEASYEQAYQNQKRREAIMWERRKNTKEDGPRI